MGQLVKGVWANEDLPRNNSEGEFMRDSSSFRKSLGTERFPVEADRYHLFVNAGCPWAYRTILYRSIKNLKNLISASYTHPAMGPEGWTFGQQPESLLSALHIHEIYTHADSTFTGRCTVPVLWDKHSHNIVNNESSEIIRMLNTSFDDFPGVDQTDYYPEKLQQEIDPLNELIYRDINNGVYQCGFAKSQAAYEKSFDALFNALELMDAKLGRDRYLCGEAITEPDWRLFSTLVRFDLAYYGQFKCNLKQIRDFKNLWPYCRDLYQTPRVAETVDVNAIKSIYYGGRSPEILPRGPAINFSEPHRRG